MDCKFINFKDLKENTWNKKISDMEGHLHLTTENSINYYSAFKGIKNKSFLVEVEKEILAAFTLAVNQISKISFNYCPSPVFKTNLKPSIRRKILQKSIQHISKMDNKIKKLKLLNHPVIFRKKSDISSQNQFEMLKYSNEYKIINTFILNLNLKKQELINNLSKYHKRNIFKSKDKLKFNIYNNKNLETLKKKFSEFRKIHFKSAGKFTRPEKTWDIMFNDLQKNLATLYSVSIKDKDISFLHCGNYLDFSWGWSQANDPEFEKDYMPRHVLEWLTILHLKKKKI